MKVIRSGTQNNIALTNEHQRCRGGSSWSSTDLHCSTSWMGVEKHNGSPVLCLAFVFPPIPPSSVCLTYCVFTLYTGLVILFVRSFDRASLLGFTRIYAISNILWCADVVCFGPSSRTARWRWRVCPFCKMCTCDNCQWSFSRFDRLNESWIYIN